MLQSFKTTTKFFRITFSALKKQKSNGKVLQRLYKPPVNFEHFWSVQQDLNKLRNLEKIFLNVLENIRKFTENVLDDLKEKKLNYFDFGHK